jgi:hypothetical protein
VARNLTCALRPLPISEDQYYWIGAVCINQEDDEEKLEQVKIIGRHIRKCRWNYSMASFTWRKDPSSFCFHRQHVHDGSTQDPDENLDKSIGLGITVFEADFTEAMEVFLAKKDILQCRHYVTPSDNLHTVARIVGGKGINP